MAAPPQHTLAPPHTMKRLLSTLSWRGCLSRRAYLRHSLATTALFLLGLGLSFIFRGEISELGTPVFLATVLLYALCLLLGFFANPITAVVVPLALCLCLPDDVLTTTPALLPEPGEGWLYIACCLLTLLLMLAASLRLLALAARRLRDAGLPGWLLMLMMVAYPLGSIGPLILVGEYDYGMSEQTALALLCGWCGFWLLLQCSVLFRATRQQIPTA